MLFIEPMEKEFSFSVFLVFVLCEMYKIIAIENLSQTIYENTQL